MADLFAAADAIKRAAKQHELFMIAADALEKLGSLDQAERESQVRVDNLAAEISKKTTELNDLREACKAVADEAEGIKADVIAASNGIAASARKQADSILSDAAEKAARLVKAATANAEGIEMRANGTAAETARKIEESRSAMAELQARSAAASAKLEDLNGRIKSAREQIVKMLGKDAA